MSDILNETQNVDLSSDVQLVDAKIRRGTYEEYVKSVEADTTTDNDIYIIGGNSDVPEGVQNDGPLRLYVGNQSVVPVLSKNMTVGGKLYNAGTPIEDVISLTTATGSTSNHLVVQTFEDLINPDTFADNLDDVYNGMIASVLNSGMTYMLIDKENITEAKSWMVQNSEYVVEYTGNYIGSFRDNLYPGLRYVIKLNDTSSGIDTPLVINCNCIYPNNVNSFEIMITSVAERQIEIRCINDIGTSYINNWINNVGNTTSLITLYPGKLYMICVDECVRAKTIIGMYCEI